MYLTQLVTSSCNKRQERMTVPWSSKADRATRPTRRTRTEDSDGSSSDPPALDMCPVSIVWSWGMGCLAWVDGGEWGVCVWAPKQSKRHARQTIHTCFLDVHSSPLYKKPSKCDHRTMCSHLSAPNSDPSEWADPCASIRAPAPCASGPSPMLAWPKTIMTGAEGRGSKTWRYFRRIDGLSCLNC